MNKKQLIVLWCVTIFLLTTLADGWGITYLQDNITAQLTLGTIILGALVLHSFKSSQSLDNKFLTKLIGSAIAISFVIVGFVYYQNVLSIVALPASEISKVKIEETPKSYENGQIFAEVYNGSAYYITDLTVRITAEATPPIGAAPAKEENPYAKYAAPSKRGFTPLADKDISDNRAESGFKKYVETQKARIAWVRDYEDTTYLSPLNTSIFHTKATDTKDMQLSYEIVAATGRKVK